MSDLISRCELFNRLAEIPKTAESVEFATEVYNIINEMPAVDIGRKKCRPIYLEDIINLYDYNRDGDYPIWISEVDDNWNKMLSGSVAVDMMGDLQVNSIGAEDNALLVYLEDNAVTDYWEQKGNSNDKAKE